MHTSEIEVLMSSIGATAEIMGTKLQPAAITLMVEDLSEYPCSSVLAALKRCRREMSGRLTLAAIIERINSADGFPGADEAWSLASRGEGDTVIINEQIGEAMQIAAPLLKDGDSIAARMAFREAYTRIVADARANHIKPKWFVSLGHDKQGRSQPIADAVRAGKLELNHALGLLSPDEKIELLKLTDNTNHPLFLQAPKAVLEDKAPLDKAQGLKHISELRAVLSKRERAA